MSSWRVTPLTQAQFDGLRESWNQLLERSQLPSVFQTWEYAHTWWRIYGASNNGPARSLMLLELRDELSLLALAPLYIVRYPGGRTEIRFLGCGELVNPDYLDFIVDRTIDPAQARQVLLDYLHAQSAWHRLHLSDIVNGQALEDGLSRTPGGLVALREQSAVCAYARLPASWEDFLESRSAKFRHNLKRSIKILTAGEGATFSVATTAAQVDDTFRALRSLHQARWSAQGRPSRYQDEQYFEFHRQLALTLLHAGHLKLYRLDHREGVLAILYCYAYAKKVFYYSGSFAADGRLARHSPGNVLRALAIQSAIADGYEEFDFLRGAAGYKDQWCNTKRETTTYFILRSGLTARWNNRDLYLRFAKRRVKKAWRSAKLFPMLARLRSVGSRGLRT